VAGRKPGFYSNFKHGVPDAFQQAARSRVFRMVWRNLACSYCTGFARRLVFAALPSFLVDAPLGLFEQR
jgi:hypothetical protein